MTIITDNIDSFFCPVCNLKTAGIIVNNETICPLCKRKLWQCKICGQKTFGALYDEGECGHCGKINYHPDVQPKIEV